MWRFVGSRRRVCVLVATKAASAVCVGPFGCVVCVCGVCVHELMC